MVSSSTDKTLKFVDLDQPGSMNTSPVDAHPLRAITFDQDGKHIFSANAEMLKVSCLLKCSFDCKETCDDVPAQQHVQRKQLLLWALLRSMHTQ